MILSPTLAQPPLPHSAFPATPTVRAHFDFYLSWMPYTHIYNIAGAPAMSVPLAWTRDDLPIGLQFVALPGREDLLFSLAAQLEHAAPWVDRLPSIHA